MPVVEISDSAYARAKKRAAEDGLPLPEYLSGLIEEDNPGEMEDYSYVFTPGVITELDEAAAEARAGNTFSRHEVDVYLEEHKAAWRAARAS